MLQPLDVTTLLQGDLLGTSYVAGGLPGRRPVQAARREKVAKRREKLVWFRRVGGNIEAAVKNGAATQLTYNAEVTGQQPAFLRDLRRLHGLASRFLDQWSLAD